MEVDLAQNMHRSSEEKKSVKEKTSLITLGTGLADFPNYFHFSRWMRQQSYDLHWNKGKVFMVGKEERKWR